MPGKPSGPRCQRGGPQKTAPPPRSTHTRGTPPARPPQRGWCADPHGVTAWPGCGRCSLPGEHRPTARRAATPLRYAIIRCGCRSGRGAWGVGSKVKQLPTCCRAKLSVGHKATAGFFWVTVLRPTALANRAATMLLPGVPATFPIIGVLLFDFRRRGGASDRKCEKWKVCHASS